MTWIYEVFEFEKGPVLYRFVSEDILASLEAICKMLEVVDITQRPTDLYIKRGNPIVIIR